MNKVLLSRMMMCVRVDVASRPNPFEGPRFGRIVFRKRRRTKSRAKTYGHRTVARELPRLSSAQHATGKVRLHAKRDLTR